MTAFRAIATLRHYWAIPPLSQVQIENRLLAVDALLDSWMHLNYHPFRVRSRKALRQAESHPALPHFF
jgi:hypothetical protein